MYIYIEYIATNKKSERTLKNKLKITHKLLKFSKQNDDDDEKPITFFSI